jgi:hypothetical protein
MSPSITWLNRKRGPDVDVYIAKSPLRCGQCGKEIASKDKITRNGERSLCLSCSGLDGLEYLPAGKASMTSQAMHFTGRKVPVFRETTTGAKRIGTLVSGDAIGKAQQRSRWLAARKAERLSQKKAISAFQARRPRSADTPNDS